MNDFFKYIEYHRKSSETERKQVNSLAVQKSILKKEIILHKLKIIETLVESRSAYIVNNREEFNHMVSLFQKKKANAILTVTIDRLARNLSEAGILESLIKNGFIKEIRTPNRVYNTIEDLSDLVGEWGAAAQYSIKLSAKIRKSNQTHFENGKLVNLRTGYQFNLKTHILEPDPLIAPHIKRIFELFSTGNYSTHTLPEALKAEGIKTKRGNYYEHSTISRILRNPIYYGAVTTKGKLITENGLHQALISKAEFELVQDILNGRHRKKRNLRNALFRNKIFCSECFCKYTFDPKVNRYNTHYDYYRCTNGKKYHSSAPKAVEEKDLIKKFAPYLKELEAEKELSELGYLLFKEELLKEKPKDETPQINSQIDVKKEELKKLKRKFNNDDFTKDEYDELKREIENEIDLLVSNLENSKPEDLQNTFELLEDVKRTAFTAHEIFINGDFEDKRNVLEKIVSNFLIGNKEISEVSLFPEYEIIRNTPKVGDFNEWRREWDSNPR